MKFPPAHKLKEQGTKAFWLPKKISLAEKLTAKIETAGFFVVVVVVA